MLACERSKVNRSIWNSATIVLACAIAVIAGSMKCDAQADETDKLLADLESTDDGKQIGAALRIAELGESASGTLPGLCRALVSDNRRVRFFVALAIESLFDGEKLVKAQKALALVEQMHDESANVRFEALKATELLDESIILVGDMVRRLTADSTKLVRVRAIAVFGVAKARACRHQSIEPDRSHPRNWKDGPSKEQCNRSVAQFLSGRCRQSCASVLRMYVG
jgi:hypothetical protein